MAINAFVSRSWKNKKKLWMKIVMNSEFAHNLLIVSNVYCLSHMAMCDAKQSQLAMVYEIVESIFFLLVCSQSISAFHIRVIDSISQNECNNFSYRIKCTQKKWNKNAKPDRIRSYYMNSVPQWINPISFVLLFMSSVFQSFYCSKQHI